MTSYTMTMHRSLQRLAALDRRCSALWSVEPGVAIDRRDDLLRRLSALDHDITVLHLRNAHALADDLDEVLDELAAPIDHVDAELDALARMWSTRSAA